VRARTIVNHLYGTRLTAALSVLLGKSNKHANREPAEMAIQGAIAVKVDLASVWRL
jgi:hypothetical protein